MLVVKPNKLFTLTMPVPEWKPENVSEWLSELGMGQYIDQFLEQSIDGLTLLLMEEHDLRMPPLNLKKLGHIKRLWSSISQLKLNNKQTRTKYGYLVQRLPYQRSYDTTGTTISFRRTPVFTDLHKAIISVLYLFIVSWANAFITVYVHQRTPDMKKYPPLPDIFLDNIPIIPWGFQLAELILVGMLMMWSVIVFVHKSRLILIRRFSAIAGTVYLLRNICIIITSLSVPGNHLTCNPILYAKTDDDSNLLWTVKTASYVWTGGGLSLNGVRSCGDYMFSGHTSGLTLLNFFITEYLPIDFYFLQTVSWLCNMFGIFFILAAHEHYSIDVFVAFYITSRLFLYYHTLSNNHTILFIDSVRFKTWFPLFSFFESNTEGIVVNEFDTPAEVVVLGLQTLKALYRELRNKNTHRRESLREEEEEEEDYNEEEEETIVGNIDSSISSLD